MVVCSHSIDEDMSRIMFCISILVSIFVKINSSIANPYLEDAGKAIYLDLYSEMCDASLNT